MSDLRDKIADLLDATSKDRAAAEAKADAILAKLDPDALSANLSECEARLLEVEAERDDAIAWAKHEHQNADEYAARVKAAEAELSEDAALLEECEAVIIAQRTRITQLEAMLPRAWKAGVDAAAVRIDTLAHNTPAYTTIVELRDHLPKVIRALPTPTAAELRDMMKENPDD